VEADWVEVHRGNRRALGLELALVLTALDIDHWLTEETGDLVLRVPALEAERARRELTEYAAEAEAPPPAAAPLHSGSGFFPGYACVLLTVHLFERFRVFGYDWFRVGRTQAQRIVEGEWWRSITALTLHADGSHLFNNLVFGTLFGVLLAQEIGVGRAWLALVVSGALGNLLNALLQPATHASIGASTGVFGLLGVLMGVQWRKPPSARGSRLRRWAPPIVGAVFLGFLGTAGVRTDVLAHVSGAAAGLGLGLTGPLFSTRSGPVTRGLAAPGALAVLVLAWWLALRG
jgi:membrane associated rhomboid family serine protease